MELYAAARFFSMKILLVAINAKYIHSNPAVFSLKSCTGPYASYVDILEFTINQQPSFLLQEIYKKHPDVIACSCYIWNYNLFDQIIPDLQKILPDTDFWAGGPEVSYHALAIQKKWNLRGVMTGPGEGSFSRLVSAYVNRTEAELPAILDHTNTRTLPLNEIPFWYKDFSVFKHRIIYYESSRGCPFSCSYCLSSIDKTMDFRSVDRVCQELDFFLAQNVPQVKFIDRTFNCKKEHALPILQHILNHDNGITNFHFEIAADLLDEDYFSILEQMRPGAIQLEIGIQSTFAKTIAEIDRQMDLCKVATAVNRIRSFQNIHIHLDLIAGLPFEDLQTFQNSFQEVYALRPQQLQLGFLKVLKGSAMESRAAAYHLTYTSLPPYEVLSTKWLSFDDVCRLKQIEEVVELYYNSGQFTHTLDFLCPYFANAYAMYESLASWYEAHDLFGIQSSRVRKYEILLDFGMSHITAEKTNKTTDKIINKKRNIQKDTQIHAFTEFLTYDFYLREHMKNRPSFCYSLAPYKEIIHDIIYQESQTHTLFPDLSDCNYRELTKHLHVEVFHSILGQPVISVFGYEKRDPLTNNGIVFHIKMKHHDIDLLPMNAQAPLN